MSYIAYGNPEMFREWQYQNYQDSLKDEEYDEEDDSASLLAILDEE